MKPIKQYVLLVDGWRGVIQDGTFYKKDSPLYKRNTAGRYRVAAKTPEEAIELLREKIGFGSIQVYYEDTNPKPEKILKYKEVKKEVLRNTVLEDVKHATSPIEKESDEIEI